MNTGLIEYQVETYRCEKTHDLECAEDENALCRVIARCSSLREMKAVYELDL